MERKYDATYKFRKAIVHIVAPLPISEEKLERRIREIHLAAWEAWNSIPVEKRLKINLGVDFTKMIQLRLKILQKND